jgi:hypothetical protein
VKFSQHKSPDSADHSFLNSFSVVVGQQDLECDCEIDHRLTQIGNRPKGSSEICKGVEDLPIRNDARGFRLTPQQTRSSRQQRQRHNQPQHSHNHAIPISTTLVCRSRCSGGSASGGTGTGGPSGAGRLGGGEWLGGHSSQLVFKVYEGTVHFVPKMFSQG